MKGYNREQKYFLILMSAIGGKSGKFEECAKRCEKVAKRLGAGRRVTHLIKRTLEEEETRLSAVWRMWCAYHNKNVDARLADRDYSRIVKRFLHEVLAS